MSLNTRTTYAALNPKFIIFPSRRSVVHSTKGIVACTQPLAATAGQRILMEGGNAAVNQLESTSKRNNLKKVS
jgi:gamma-glutamyltranspeptidase / glutathione hydrolase